MLIAVAAIAMGLLDFMWLRFVASRLYRNHLRTFMKDKPDMLAALGFYGIYVIGIVCLVVQPALVGGSLATASLYGAVLGLVAYATYGLTNRAVFQGFSLQVVVPDIIWGACMTAAVSALTFVVGSQWVI